MKTRLAVITGILLALLTLSTGVVGFVANSEASRCGGSDSC